MAARVCAFACGKHVLNRGWFYTLDEIKKKKTNTCVRLLYVFVRIRTHMHFEKNSGCFFIQCVSLKRNSNAHHFSTWWILFNICVYVKSPFSQQAIFSLPTKIYKTIEQKNVMCNCKKKNMCDEWKTSGNIDTNNVSIAKKKYSKEYCVNKCESNNHVWLNHRTNVSLAHSGVGGSCNSTCKSSLKCLFISRTCVVHVYLCL